MNKWHLDHLKENIVKKIRRIDPLKNQKESILDQDQDLEIKRENIVVENIMMIKIEIEIEGIEIINITNMTKISNIKNRSKSSNNSRKRNLNLGKKLKNN